MANVRMKIAAGATVLGLGGLAGFALGSNDGPATAPVAAVSPADQKPKVHTQVVHRTVHVRPKGSEASATAASVSAARAPTAQPAPAAPGPAATPVNSPATELVTTNTSGGGSGADDSYADVDGAEYEDESEYEDEGEYEYEGEGEGDD